MTITSTGDQLADIAMVSLFIELLSNGWDREMAEHQIAGNVTM
ncbi:hypothetical protein [Halomonas rhizosphaerae]|uniref:Uncharacterized protein n=1 Tax=Halomonas rhizosphaerae TaxID=3043296 RepID=A0ABT6UZK8_9GAMM|nr:hypothetical protein [Halomonas rhizosphaerae]MDI5891389.1 hypothetical protein [Halomonas rhizosphaerae]MDI5921728.1 hypothetical protein [Halomonas rhizosphaerae]